MNGERPEGWEMLSDAQMPIAMQIAALHRDRHSRRVHLLWANGLPLCDSRTNLREPGRHQFDPDLHKVTCKQCLAAYAKRVAA